MTEQNDEKLRVILCKSGKLAETIEMEDSLDAMQELVGGLIEEYMEDVEKEINGESPKINNNIR